MASRIANFRRFFRENRAKTLVNLSIIPSNRFAARRPAVAALARGFSGALRRPSMYTFRLYVGRRGAAMKRKPVLYLGATSLALLIAGGVGLIVSEHAVSAQAPAGGAAPARGAAQGGATTPARGATGGGGAPSYRVNPLWPQLLPNH